MIVLYVTPIFNPIRGGASVYFNLLARFLIRKRAIRKIVILTSYLPGASPYQKKDEIVILRILPPSFLFRPRLVGPMLANIFLPPVIFVSTIMCARKYGVDLVHFFAGRLYARGTQLAARLLKIPCIADIRDQGSATNKSLSRSNAIICCSKNIFRIAQKFVDSKKLVYIPVPVEKIQRYKERALKSVRCKYNIPSQAKMICFIGDIDPSKGVFELIEAFNIFKDIKPGFKLILIGENGIGKRLARILQKNRDIVYTGPLPHNEAMALLQDSQLLVLPSKSEGLPRVCLEAISLGIKCLCPSVVVEIVEYCPEFVLHERSPSQIAKKMEELLTREKKLEYPVEIHDAEKLVEKLYESYNLLLSRKLRNANFD